MALDVREFQQALAEFFYGDDPDVWVMPRAGLLIGIQRSGRRWGGGSCD